MEPAPEPDPVAAGSGPLFTESVLVVEQKAKYFEMKAEYKVFDQVGAQIGSVCRARGSALLDFAQMTSDNGDLYHRYEIRGANDVAVLVLNHVKKNERSVLFLDRPDGTNIGVVAKKNSFGKIRMSLDAGGVTVGSINAENWRGRNFNIQDETGQEVARISHLAERLLPKLFSNADSYRVEIHGPLTEPLRSLVVAAALCIDTAFRQGWTTSVSVGRGHSHR